MTVRWGVLGAGWLATKATAAAIHHADGALLQATGARDINRARSTEPVIAYDSYAAVVEDPDVDAIYICLANDAHLPWIRAAITAGKHVLCEKPMVLTAEEAGAAFALADAAGVHLVEATWSRWHPRMRRIVDLASSGELGDLHRFLATFTFDEVTPGNYRLSPAHGGGALYDAGIYPLHTLVACLPEVEEFKVVEVQRVMSDAGVDLTTRAKLTWGDDTLALIAGSFELPPSQRLSVRGSRGNVHVPDNEAFTTWRAPTTLVVDGHTQEFATVDAYQIMFEEVSDRIRGGDGWLLPPRDTIRVARLVDALRS